MQFVFPIGPQQWRTENRRFQVMERIDEFDLLTLRLQPGGHEPKPVRIVQLGYRPRIGEEIGIVGYSHGSILLHKGKRISRFGPLMQTGHIAALSPFDSDRPDELLLDLRVAPASSGSPVFLARTGEVIGILQKGQAGNHAIVSVAMPISSRENGVLVVQKRELRDLEVNEVPEA
jgi:hypothetical protein